MSVIVPVFNDADRLERLLDLLRRQSYPADSFEVLVVDNRSTDRTPSIVESHGQRPGSNVIGLAHRSAQSSYGARNAGIRRAKGDILAFIDSDCLPSTRWLEAGVEAMQSEQADVAGGAVRFVLPDKPSSAELVDSVTSLQVASEITRHGIAQTANLFVRRRVFDEIGLFPENAISGGDFIWTKEATRAGHRLVFSPDAFVEHPARSWLALLKKHFRVGTGQRLLLAQRGVSGKDFWIHSLKALMPPLWSNFRAKLHGIPEDVIRRRAVSLWLCRWLCRVAAVMGRFWELGRR